MSDLFAGRSRGDFAARCAAVKRALSFIDAARALNIVSGPGEAGDCPHCRARAKLLACHGGLGWYCAECASRGDVISLARAVLRASPIEAVMFLERTIAARRDNQTMELSL